MNCHSCGASLSQDANFCRNCGIPVQKAAAPPSENTEEINLAESACALSIGKSLRASRGRILLTNRRIIYFKHGVAKTLLMGHAVHLTKGDYDKEIALSDIARFREGRQGINHYLDVFTIQGDHLRIFIYRYEPWITALRGVLPQIPIQK